MDNTHPRHRGINMPSSLFNGTVNGTPAKSFEGEVVYDEIPRYAILKLKIGNDLWMMDLTGLTDTPGLHTYTLILKKHDGKAFTEHYSGETTQKVFLNPKQPNIFGFFKSTIKVKDQKGKEITVQGDFLWDTARFNSAAKSPAGGQPQAAAPAAKQGSLIDAKLLVGKWNYVTSINTVDGTDFKMKVCDKWIMEYRADGTFSETQVMGQEYSKNGKYSVNGAKVKREGLIEIEIIELDAKTMVFKAAGVKQVWDRVP